VVSISGTPVSWLSQKQPVVALSTAEAEYVALCEAAKKVVWLRRLLEDVGEKQPYPTVVFEDNRAAISLTENPGQHPKVKHIATRYHFTREAVANGELEIQFCPSGEMVADIFTKPLPRESFVKLRSYLGLILEPKLQKEC
jgi:hypothetical protein